MHIKRFKNLIIYFTLFFPIYFGVFSCSKNKSDTLAPPPSTKQEAIKVYQEALEALKNGQYIIASRKFDQSESLLPQTPWAAKSSLMSSYCLYTINFTDEALLNLKRFIRIYPADPNVDYAQYLIAIIYYEQILRNNDRTK